MTLTYQNFRTKIMLLVTSLLISVLSKLDYSNYLFIAVIFLDITYYDHFKMKLHDNGPTFLSCFFFAFFCVVYEINALMLEDN